jgi:hypothetical protein
VIQASGVAAAAGAASATPNTMASTLELIYEWSRISTPYVAHTTRSG